MECRSLTLSACPPPSVPNDLPECGDAAVVEDEGFVLQPSAPEVTLEQLSAEELENTNLPADLDGDPTGVGTDVEAPDPVPGPVAEPVVPGPANPSSPPDPVGKFDVKAAQAERKRKRSRARHQNQAERMTENELNRKRSQHLQSASSATVPSEDVKEVKIQFAAKTMAHSGMGYIGSKTGIDLIFAEGSPEARMKVLLDARYKLLQPTYK